MQKEPLEVVVVDKQENNLCINHDLIVRNYAAPKIPSLVSESGDLPEEDTEDGDPGIC